MSREIGIYTETMAKVYAAQGHWGRAAEIYRYLLSESPARKELVDALAEVEIKLNTNSPRDPDQLVPIFREWIELLLRREKLQKLKNLTRTSRNQTGICNGSSCPGNSKHEIRNKF
jgi:hypothetical protein